MANPHADLGALSVNRSAPMTTGIRLSRRWGTRVFVPGFIVAGFATLVVWAAWDAIVPPVPVKVVPVQVQTGTVEVSGQELFKANGWVEPRPLPIDVPVQTEGMYRVKEVLVNPGQSVAKDQLLVQLDDTRAALDLESAEKRHARRLAAVRAGEADVKKGEVAAANATALVALAKSEGAADVEVMAAEVARAEADVKAAELTAAVERDLWMSKAITSDVKVRLANQALAVAQADRDAAAAKLSKAKVAAEVRVKQAELAQAAAGADLVSLKARVDELAQDAADAAVEIRKARLEQDRTRITSPIKGVIMALNVRVGSFVGGKSTSPDPKGAVTLYDPKQLQVRVEVPVAKFGLVTSGYPVEIEVEDVLPGTVMKGTVLYDTHQANIARNSVPVKISLPDEPPAQLRPDMIASVRFRSPPSADKPKTATARRLVVPRKLLITEGEQTHVWVANAVSGRAELRPVEFGPGQREQQGEFAEVIGGLNPTDKLIATGREQLKPGTRIKIVGEDR